MTSKIFGRVVLAVALATVSSAHAQQPATQTTAYPECKKQPSKAEIDAAHGAYLAGRHSFDEGDYATAIMYFKDAYRRDCTKHELLPIVARAYELSQNRAEAILALETFLKRVPPNDPQVEAIKKRITNLRSSETKPAVGTTPPTDTASATPSPATSTQPVSGAPPATSPPAADTASRPTPIAPLIVVGVGAVGAIIGTVVLVGGLNDRAEAVDRCPTTGPTGRQCPEGVNSNQVSAQFDSGTKQATLGGIVLGGSVAVAVGGLIWYAVERGSSSSPQSGTLHNARASVSPWLGTSAGGATYVLHF